MFFVRYWNHISLPFGPKPMLILSQDRLGLSQILDTVTSASIQSKEIGSGSTPSDVVKGTDQLEKKKGFIDWRNLIKPMNEEKDHWVPDEAVVKCKACAADFNAFKRKCRNCGDIFCDKCTQGRIALTANENAQPVRVCDRCMAEVVQRLSNKVAVAPGRATGCRAMKILLENFRSET
ncbi:protein FREE1-like isoform X2 [Salvia hispanica]|uniref:protein FREE1-like isoform X2 n=1 Tax=Salvia hispanica TaxID=49212 RepID=UPI002008EFC5|nr:protein FREE1-like isoform X2 [Salvia hispanica]